MYVLYVMYVMYVLYCMVWYGIVLYVMYAMYGWMDVCMHACMYVYTHVVKSYERAHRCRRQSGTQAALPGCQTSSWAKPGVKSWADTQRPISHDFINGYSWDTYYIYIYIYTYIYMIILICIYIQYMEPISYLGVSETHQ